MPRLSEAVSLWMWDRSAAWSNDGTYLAVGGDSGDVRIWDMKTRRQIATLSGQAGEVESSAFFPDNQRIAVGGKSDVRIWNFILEQDLLLLPTPKQRPVSIAIDPTGNRIVAVM